MLQTMPNINFTLSNNCGNCSKPDCNLGCARCKFRYCSKICQQQDFQRHRLECLRIIFQNRGLHLNAPVASVSPSENDKENVLESNTVSKASSVKSESSYKSNATLKSLQKHQIPESSLQSSQKLPSNRQKIAITSFIRSNCVYIRNADEDTTSRFLMTQKVVNQLSENLFPLKSLPEEGSFLIVNLNGFKRCAVQDVRSEKQIKVFLSDVGQQEIVNMDKLYEPGPRLEKLAATSFIKMIKLENVPEFYLNKRTAEYARSLVGEQVDLELEIGSQTDEGKIFDVNKNEYINDVLFCYAQDEDEMVEFEPEDKDREFTFISDEIIKIHSIPKKELPLETELNLMIYDNSQLEKNYILSCVNIEDLGEIKEAIRDIHNYGVQNEHQTYEPEEDDVCIAFYTKKKKWSRAKFIEICEDNPNECFVCFIDFGKTCNVPLEKVIKYPEAFSFIPNFLYTCRVFGLPSSPSEELLERLYELLPENVSVKAQSLSVVDTNFHLIEMEAITKILSLEDLI